MVKEAVDRLIQLIEEDKIDFSEFEVLLSAEEKTIINVLKKKKRAMNINEIRNAIIDDFIKFIKYYGIINELEKELKVTERVVKLADLGTIGQGIRWIPLDKTSLEKNTLKKYKISQKLEAIKKEKPSIEYWEGEFEDIPELFVKIYNELKERGIFKNGKILERDKRTVAELINKYGIARIPSYKTIERILNELEACGFVVSRPDSGGKGKKLYAINPKLLKVLKN